ncbi:MAG TPA: DinB family protein [Bryobacteraceae bacterium]|nr:DinB family protein [Bryobacteraceae bacterium]
MTFSIIGTTHLRYNRWATERVLDEINAMPAELLVKDLKGSFPSIYETMAHLYQADSIWWDRLSGRPSGTLADYPAPGCTWELKEAWMALHYKMIDWASGLTDDDWTRQMSYKTLAGMPMLTPLWEMVLHVVNHGSHHRGQVTTMIRQLGSKPVNLDLLAFYRERYGQQ